ncbi:hypothetical protein [Lacrimispora sp.]|uniref:hypothetical protein n=1 Tax=Lacrimispora sp. TaxID=2719234 RepID=UPI0039948221
MVDINKPIIPWEGMGGISLYSTIKETRELLENTQLVSGILLNNLWVRYEIKDTMYLFFHLVNGKLFKITTLDNYKGKLFGNIGVGTLESDLLKYEPTFIYDDFEEVYETPKGAFLETDPISRKVTQISVYIKELDSNDFENANW